MFPAITPHLWSKTHYSKGCNKNRQALSALRPTASWAGFAAVPTVIAAATPEARGERRRDRRHGPSRAAHRAAAGMSPGCRQTGHPSMSRHPLRQHHASPASQRGLQPGWVLPGLPAVLARRLAVALQWEHADGGRPLLEQAHWAQTFLSLISPPALGWRAETFALLSFRCTFKCYVQIQSRRLWQSWKLNPGLLMSKATLPLCLYAEMRRGRLVSARLDS